MSFYNNKTIKIKFFQKEIQLPDIENLHQLYSCFARHETDWYGIRYCQGFDEDNHAFYWHENANQIIGYLDDHYRTFYIPKRSGAKRRIDEPDEQLKRIQKLILKDILYAIPCSKYAKAYVPEITINDNIRYHIGKKIVVTLDIEDFFASVKGFHVNSVFRMCDYNPAITAILTNLCLYNGSIPQGAPTSPYLSNLVMYSFDIKIGEYCANRGIKYTRYADDMTFSGDNFDIAALVFEVDKELRNMGLKRNKNKVKVMRQSNRQKATGIVLNRKAQIPREYRAKIRQEIHYIQKYGLESHLEHIGSTPEKYLSQLIGRINYVLSVNPNDQKMISYKKYIKALYTIYSFEK